MGFERYLKELLEGAETNTARQITYVLSQLENDNTEPCVSDEEEPAEESEDDISYYAEESDNALYGGKSVLVAGEELLSEFLAGGQAAFQQSKVSPQTQYDTQEELKDRPITPVYGFTKTPIDNRIPSAMRAKPKIPRTPIPKEKLEEVKRADDEFFRKAIFVQRNDQKPRNQQNSSRAPSSEMKEELQTIPESVRKKETKTEARARAPEEKKYAKEVKKELHYASAKREQPAPVVLALLKC
eukprot:TRINITY_DN4510_c0_g1_i13.p1 TRINITY_DN4510_c0_g1~~TRINITY_DN4510_c0_g1_i13.p1  ORF type:complete len:242 (+),score=95.72 TRINITY_DN4510_c0_g1_i13:1852-2577(+)